MIKQDLQYWFNTLSLDDLWELNSSRRVIGNIHEKDKLVDFDHVKGSEE